MSENEMNSYRFGSGQDPTDEMLAQIMHEAALDAKRRSEEAMRSFFEELRAGASSVAAVWKEKINGVRNGQ